MLGVGTDGPVGLDTGPALRSRDDRVAGERRPARTMDQDERDAWAVLATVDGLGPAAFMALLARHGSAGAVLALADSPNGVRQIVGARSSSGGRDPGRSISEATAEQIVLATGQAATILRRIRELGASVVTLDDPTYPERLTGIHLPPAVLFVLGDPGALRVPRACAVVGTRHPTGHGRMTATRISNALVAASASVVSGLALGIDGAAHEATVRAGGVTVAVLGSGVGVVSPSSHRRLAEAIVAGGGAVVSELGPDVHPGPGTFPRRNRLISGLADATIVVEAPASSGALLTAGWAMDQGRACFVVPGQIDAPASAGCLSFLREWHGEARIVTGIPQLIADLGYAEAQPARAERVGATLGLLGTTEALVAEAILAGRVTVDELVAVSGLPVAAVLATLTLLERQGMVVGAYGRYRPAGSLLAPRPVPKRR